MTTGSKPKTVGSVSQPYGGSPISAGNLLPRLGADPADAQSTDTNPAGGGKRILIIEDDAVVAGLYKTKLQKEGYRIDIASDGQAGFYGIHELKPDAVLLDLMLPKMDGLQILRKIRAQKQFTKLPVVVFSNAFMSNMLNDAVEAGANVVYNKSEPSTPARIMGSFKELLFPYLSQMQGQSGSGNPAAQSQPSQEAAPAAPQQAQPAAQDRMTSPWQLGVPSGPIPNGLTTFIPRPASIPANRPAQNTQDGRAEMSNVLSPQFISDLQPANESLAAVDADEASMEQELLQMFFGSAPELMSGIRKHLQEFSKATENAARLPHLNELYRKIHSFTGNAGMAGLEALSNFCACLEAFLSELMQKPASINASTLRTVAAAVDILAMLIERGSSFKMPPSGEALVLVVDDEVLSRRAVTFGLDKAQLKSVALDHPRRALSSLETETFELIILDVDMPEMDGFELCSQIRKLPKHKSTPVVFITSLTDFQSRTKSILSGGNDFIGKPFMFLELAVKALTFILRGRMMVTKHAATLATASAVITAVAAA